MSCYLVLRVGARGCAASHLILQPTIHQDPSKNLQSTACRLPMWRRQVEGSPEMHRKVKCAQLAQTFQIRVAHLCAPSTGAKYLDLLLHPLTQQMLCAAQRLQNTKPTPFNKCNWETEAARECTGANLPWPQQSRKHARHLSRNLFVFLGEC